MNGIIHTYTLMPEVQFSKAPRYDTPVHRVRRAEQVQSIRTGEISYRTTWLCGGSSDRALLVDDPAAFSYSCERCDIALTSVVVYRCFSADGQLLYIGSCARWETRASRHEKESRWWPTVARVDKTPQPNIGLARQMERAAIRAEAPLHNLVHNVKRFRREGHGWAPVTEAA